MDIKFDPTTDPSETFFHMLRTDRGITQSDLAREAQCTRMSVARTEQLNYPEPLPSVATALSLSTDTPLNELERQYRIDVLDRRRYTSELLYPWMGEYYNHNTDHYNSFKQWRIVWAVGKGLPTSIIKFSSMICVHPDIITNYERRQCKDRTTSIPKSLAVAFKEMGYEDSFLTNYIGGSY